MIEIDLLHGQGKPIKSNPLNIAAVTLLFMIPIGLGLIVSTSYMQAKHESVIKAKQLQQLDDKAASLAKARVFQENVNSYVSVTDDTLRETARIMPRYTQWSPIIQAIARKIPEGFVLKDLSVTKQPIQIDTTQVGNPKQKIKINVFKRTLHISLYNFSESDGDASIENFIHNLKRNSSFKQQVEEVRLVGHTMETMKRNQVPRYDIDCILIAAKE